MGVVVPHGFYKVPWREWLPQTVGGDVIEASKIHDAKNAMYVARMAELEIYPLMDVARKTGGIILTGASYEAASAVVAAFGLLHLSLRSELNLDGKIELLNATSDHGVYFDDDVDACLEMRRKTSWQIVTV